MESTEREYYQALFRRDYAEARRLFRIVSASDHWAADHLQREGHKCGMFDEADGPDGWDVVEADAVQLVSASEIVIAG